MIIIKYTIALDSGALACFEKLDSHFAMIGEVSSLSNLSR